MSRSSSRPSLHSMGFTLMEVLVVCAIILVLAAIAFPVISTIRQKANHSIALNNMRQLAAATATYSAQNDGLLPAEDAKGTDSWQATADPANSKAWYNSLPKQVGLRPVSDFALSPREFYTKQNLIWLPGALYPESDKKLVRPMFAIAINTKLQRKDASGEKSARLAQITNASKTALFLEQGLPSEKKTLPQQPKYDGSPKGSAKSLVARYGEKGLVTFVDGHVEDIDPKEALTETGKFPFPPTDIIWTRNPEEDPNK